MDGEEDALVCREIFEGCGCGWCGRHGILSVVVVVFS